MRRALSIAAIILLVTTSASAGSLTWRFNTDGDLDGWTPQNFASVEVSGGMLRGVTEWDPQLISPVLNIEADRYSVVEFRVTSSVSGTGEIFWHHEGNSFSADRQTRHMVHASEEPRVYRVDMARHENWRGTIQRIRLDIINPADAEVQVDYIRITSAPTGILPNAAFEDDLSGDGLPDGWAISAAVADWSDEHVVEADRSLMIGASQPDHRVATATARAQLDHTGLYDLTVAIPHTEGRANLSVGLRFFDIFGDEIPGSALTLSDIERGQAGMRHIRGKFETPKLAATVAVALTVRGDNARAWWDAVELRHVRELPLPCERPIETWRANWIWAQDTLGQDHVPAFFRRSFQLPTHPDRVTSAVMQITADDRYVLWINGEQIGQSEAQDGWRTPQTYDLQPHLREGRNLIAVETWEVVGAEGLLAEAEILWPRGELLLATDETWKAVGEAPDGWYAPEFDDRQWPPAAVVAEAGASPWGNLPYTYAGRREEIELRQVDVPAQITAGQKLRLSATISQLPASAADHPLRISLRREGVEVLCWAKPVSEVTRETNTSVRIGPVELDTSRFLPPGTYSVAMGFPHMNYAGRDGVAIGDLRVRPPARAEPKPVVRIAEHNGLPTLHIDGKPHAFMHYQELEVDPRRIGNMAEAGVHIYFLRADDIGWTGSGTYDYSAWDAKVTRLLMYDPEARIIPAFDLSGRHQQWWLPENSDELARTEDGGTQVGIYHHAGEAISLASKSWRDQSGEALRGFVSYNRTAPYSSRIIGYLPASGVSWEWQHWSSVGDWEPSDYSEPMRQAFREWLMARYDSEKALRDAWGMPEVTFDTVQIPSVEQRGAADHMLFRDPRTSGYVIDFYLFYQQVMVDGILHYFGIIKDASDGRALAGTYYGYVVTMLSGARRAGDAGHMALSRLLESDLCDFLISPYDYSQRSVGESMNIMSATGSVLANDKLWAMESDLRTHYATDERQRRHGAPDHLDGTISQLRRSFASSAAKGLAVRWYDFSHGWISGDARQGQAIGQLREIADRWLTWDRSPDPRGIAIVVDEDTPAAYLSHHIQAMFWLVFRQKAPFERVGAPWNIYLLDDVVAGRVPPHRAYFFLNCFKMTSDQRDYIDRELKSDGRTLVWFYAPGYIDDDLDVERISALTGMQFEEIAQMRPWSIELVEDHPWAEGISAADNPQPEIEIGPVFVPQEDDLEVVGRWTEGGEPGLVVKRHDDWTSVYSAGPILSPTLLKRICADAGVAIRVEGTEPSYVSRHLIGLHSAVPRTETLHFDGPTRVIDLVTDEILCVRETSVEVKVPGPGTRLLEIRPVR